MALTFSVANRRLNSRRQAFGKSGLVQHPDAKIKPPCPKYLRRLANSASVSTKSLWPFINRKGVSKSVGSVSLTFFSSCTLIVDAFETNRINWLPTSPQSSPSLELYRMRPMKNVACLSSDAARGGAAPRTDSPERRIAIRPRRQTGRFAARCLHEGLSRMEH